MINFHELQSYGSIFRKKGRGLPNAYIATPHPEPESVLYYRDYLKTLQLYESYSPKIVRLLKEAHEELMEEFIE